MSALPTNELIEQVRMTDRLRLVASRLSTTIARSVDELEHLREEWDYLAESVGAPIYQSYDWCRIWWAHYGQGREPRIFLFHQDGELVGVAPMLIDRVRIGPVSLRVAKIMGSDFSQSVCDLPIRADWAEAVFDELARRLICDDRCEAIHFGPMSECSPRLGAVRAAVARCSGLAAVIHDRKVGSHTNFDLPGSVDAYMKSLSKNARKSLRKGWKRLEADFDIDVDVDRDGEDVAGKFGDFIRLHQKQWTEIGRLGHFGDWPHAEEFHRDLATAMAARGRTRMIRMTADDQTVAHHYSYHFGRRCHWLLTGRITGDRWERYSLGKASFLSLVEHAISEGIETIDACAGHYDYKLHLGAGEQGVRSILIAADRPAVLTRARLFCSLACAIDKLYYRLYFCRLAPRLPRRRRGLWNTWIRTRL